MSVREALDLPNRAHAFTAAFFEELARSGVGHVCVTPGSRSTPLVAAAVAEPELRCWSHLDERSSAFFALGLAKATRTPAALVCTSGTAAANFHPAVIEAHHARVPLLVLTADRPPELRGWGAGQTIDQLHLYGGAVRWFAETPVPEAGDAALRHARSLACRAVAVAEGHPAGPVHLNLPFREPLEPVAESAAGAADLTPLASEGRGEAPYTRAAPSPAAPEPELAAALAEFLRQPERGVIACGPLDATPIAAWRIARLAAILGWPLLAEPTSQLRRGPYLKGASVISTSDLFLRDEATAARLAPDCVLRFGDTPTSKPFRLWLERHRPNSVILVDPDVVWHDPSHLVSSVLRADPELLCEALLQHLGERPAPLSAWLRDFLEAELRTHATLEDALAVEESLLEPRAVRELGEALPDGALLYVSNSMPVRDLDAFLAPGSSALRVLCNRGANGIDGMVSSALGAAAAGAGPVVLLTGDLALLHDAGGLLAARRHALRATIVVLDNDGGGIFSLLPIAKHGESVGFEEYFRAPHGLDLGAVAAAYGARFTRVGSWEQFRTALGESFEAEGVSLVAVPIDRDRNLAHGQELQRAVSEALAGGAS
jgi:2-succinyl-5-enolpyruvyl-6-hydroxy-3-cyclohexene-1-carboxylate synthase